MPDAEGGGMRPTATTELGGEARGRLSIGLKVAALVAAVLAAVVVPTRYLDPAEAAKLNEPDRPDDWFKTDLLAEFLPQ